MLACIRLSKISYDTNNSTAHFPIRYQRASELFVRMSAESFYRLNAGKKLCDLPEMVNSFCLNIFR